MNTRREFLKLSALGAGSLLLPPDWLSRAFASTSGGLHPGAIPKYVMPLIIPPAMPRNRTISQNGIEIDYYAIAMRQFQQQILPTGMMWSDPITENPRVNDTEIGSFITSLQMHIPFISMNCNFRL